MTSRKQRILLAAVITTIAIAGARLCEIGSVWVGSVLLTVASLLLMAAPLFVD